MKGRAEPSRGDKRGDRRHGESWSPFQQAKNDVVYLLVRCVTLVLPLVPRAALVRVGRALGAFAFVALRAERKLALENLAHVGIGETIEIRRSIAKACFIELGESIGEIGAVLAGGKFEPLTFPETEQEKLRAALREGRGVLFVSAHLGAWERVFATLKASGFPIVTVARESYDPRLTALYEKWRGQGSSLYRGDSRFPFAVMRHLKKGGIVGIPMDLASRVPCASVPFLGRLAETPIGPARLALARRAPVMVGTLAPSADGLRAGRSLRLERVSSDGLDGARGSHQLTSRLAEVLSERIRALPTAWLWMHDRYGLREKRAHLARN